MASPDVIFDLIDVDKSGTITSDELLQHQLAAGQDPSDVAELFKAMDTNGDGVVSREEFAAAFGSVAGTALTPRLLGQIYDVIEASGNGSLSQKELFNFMAHLEMQARSDEQRSALKNVPEQVGKQFQDGLQASLSRDEWLKFAPGSVDALAIAIFAQLATEAMSEPELTKTSLDELHLQNAGGGMVSSATLDADGVENGAKLRKRFSQMDTDGDGAVSKEEIGDMHLSLSEEQLDQLFSKADTNGNGSISFDEFVKALADFDIAAEADLNALDDLLPE